MKTNKLSPIVKTSLFLVACIMYCAAFGQKSTKENSHTVDPNDPNVAWGAAPPAFPGCSVTILNGDISKPRLDFFFKVEPNREVVRHTHNSAERMILVQGNLEVQYDGEDAVVLKPGMYAYGPAKKPHRAKCLDGDPCILFVGMNEPFSAEPLSDD